MTQPFSPTRKQIVWLLLGLILAGTIARAWKLTAVPYGFVYDEAYKAVDSLWLLRADSIYFFLPGNNGKTTLFEYIVGPMMVMLGYNVFAYRLTAVLAGIATIPLMYRWVAAMFHPQPNRHYLGLLAATGIAFSFWHLEATRTGLRASMVPFFFILTAYLFWRGWKGNSTGYMVAAGVSLGLSQYTYWPAVIIFPLPFGLLVIIWTLSRLIPEKDYQKGGANFKARPVALSSEGTDQPVYSVKKVWLWLGVMALVSLLIFLPLGWVLYQNPIFIEYIFNSSAADKELVSQRGWYGHLWDSLRLVLDGPPALWSGQAGSSFGFDWLAFAGFWAGLIIAVKRWRQPVYLFLPVSLLALWIPAPLGDMNYSDLRLPDMVPAHQAIGMLRLVAMTPAYYALVALGWGAGIKFAVQKLTKPRPVTTAITAFGLVMCITGGLNLYNLFIRWPQDPQLYGRYNGPIFDLTHDIIRAAQDYDVLIPFQLYTQPTMRFFLDSRFPETPTPPSPGRPALLITTADAAPAAYMWLSHSANGAGLAYLTPVQDTAALLGHTSGQSLQSYNIAAPLLVTANTYRLDNLLPLRPNLTTWPGLNRLNYTWNNEVALVDYQLSPNPIRVGQSLTLNLYWYNLTDQPIIRDVFIHAINQNGEGVGQVDGFTINDRNRWRGGKISPIAHTLQLAPNLAPGPYLIRLGVFNARSGVRSPVLNDRGEVIGNQAIFGLFYVTNDDHDPLQPATPVQAMLNGQIRLLGCTFPPTPDNALQLKPDAETPLSLKLFWQADDHVTGDYTIFSQLLTDHNQYVTGYDAQPINGNYPTSLWQPGEIIVEDINLKLPAQIAEGEYHLVTGLYDLSTGQRLVAVDNQGQPIPDNMVILANTRVSSGKLTFKIR